MEKQALLKYHICFILSTTVNIYHGGVPNAMITEKRYREFIEYWRHRIPSFIYFAFGIPSFISFFAFGILSFIYFFAFGILTWFIFLPSISLALLKFIYFFIKNDLYR